MTTIQGALLLRDAALTQSREGREEAIRLVREALVRKYPSGSTFTGDDVMDLLPSLGLEEGDTRWTANVVVRWPLVEACGYTPSRRRHGSAIRQWRRV